jgi:hypothetical protein
LARLGGFRRPLGIPNPRSYIKLAQVIEQQWLLIDNHLKSQTLAITRPIVTRTAERAVRPQFDRREAAELRARMWRGKRFILRGDVSQCYPSMYTHAIPWALHSKKTAKSNRNKTEGDRIDKAVRDCSSGQTVGIPIGPDTSFVVAEIVLTAVDAALARKAPPTNGFRYLDDYELAYSTRGEAEVAQAELEGALGAFELAVNPFKTKVLELPQPFQATWTHELRTFPIRTDSPIKTGNDLVALFSRAAEVATHNLGALTYALRKSQEITIDERSWPVYQSLVWNAVSVEPTTMALALDLLQVKAADLETPISRSAAAEVLEALIARNGPLGNASEVAWALWAAITLEVDLTASAAAALSGLEDDFVILLALDAQSRGRFPAGGPDTSAWETLVEGSEALQGDHWLLAYEGSVQGWLPTAHKLIPTDDFFNALHKRGIRFYDQDPSRDPFTGPAGPPQGAPIPESYF